MILTFLFQSCLVLSTLIQRLNSLWHIYVYDIFIHSFIYLFLQNTSLNEVSSAKTAVLCDGKHTVQTSKLACAAIVPFYTCCRLSLQEQWQCVEGKTVRGVSDSIFNTMSQWTGCFFYKNGLFFFSRILQFFLGLYSNSVLLPLSLVASVSQDI